jgi:16S rRNA processing protein RimM
VTEGESKRVLLGRISAAHGIRGEVLIKSFTEVSENIGTYGPLSDEQCTRVFEIVSARPTPKGVVARLKGITDRNAAEALRGTALYVERGKLPAAAEGEFYHADLIGLAAIDREGKTVGKIVAVHDFGAGDLIEIRLAGSNKTELVPFTDDAVPEVDIAARRAVVVLPHFRD